MVGIGIKVNGRCAPTQRPASSRPRQSRGGTVTTTTQLQIGVQRKSEIRNNLIEQLCLHVPRSDVRFPQSFFTNSTKMPITWFQTRRVSNMADMADFSRELKAPSILPVHCRSRRNDHDNLLDNRRLTIPVDFRFDANYPEIPHYYYSRRRVRSRPVHRGDPLEIVTSASGNRRLDGVFYSRLWDVDDSDHREWTIGPSTDRDRADRKWICRDPNCLNISIWTDLVWSLI